MECDSAADECNWFFLFLLQTNWICRSNGIFWDICLDSSDLMSMFISFRPQNGFGSLFFSLSYTVSTTHSSKQFQQMIKCN